MCCGMREKRGKLECKKVCRRPLSSRRATASRRRHRKVFHFGNPYRRGSETGVSERVTMLLPLGVNAFSRNDKKLAVNALRGG